MDICLEICKLNREYQEKLDEQSRKKLDDKIKEYASSIFKLKGKDEYFLEAAKGIYEGIIYLLLEGKVDFTEDFLLKTVKNTVEKNIPYLEMNMKEVYKEDYIYKTSYICASVYFQSQDNAKKQIEADFRNNFDSYYQKKQETKYDLLSKTENLNKISRLISKINDLHSELNSLRGFTNSKFFELKNNCEEYFLELRKYKNDIDQNMYDKLYKTLLRCNDNIESLEKLKNIYSQYDENVRHSQY